MTCEEQQASTYLRDTPLTFAIDVSGSTHGRTLQCEKNFVSRVVSYLSPESKLSTNILPWHDRSLGVGPLSYLDLLRAGNGTQPRVMLEAADGKAALQKSPLWFLMTDGLVGDHERLRFMDCVTSSGIHGNTCVAVIFGSTRAGPSSCNISVGVSLFALCPDCLFLFYDTASEDMIILQAKGVFNSVLGGAENPVIDSSTSWSSLPRLSLDTLTDIAIPPPKLLGKDEVKLRGSLVINFEDLWNNRLSEEKVAQIFDNEDNLGTVIMSAQAQGQSPQFQAWAQQQTFTLQDPVWKPRTDINNQARTAYLKLLTAMKQGVADDGLVPFQQKLREAHEANIKAFLTTAQREADAARTRRETISYSDMRSYTPITNATAFNSTASYKGVTASKRGRSSDNAFSNESGATVPPSKKRTPNGSPSQPGSVQSAPGASNMQWHIPELGSPAQEPSLPQTMPVQGFPRPVLTEQLLQQQIQQLEQLQQRKLTQHQLHQMQLQRQLLLQQQQQARQQQIQQQQQAQMQHIQLQQQARLQQLQQQQLQQARIQQLQQEQQVRRQQLQQQETLLPQAPPNPGNTLSPATADWVTVGSTWSDVDSDAWSVISNQTPGPQQQEVLMPPPGQLKTVAPPSPPPPPPSRGSSPAWRNTITSQDLKFLLWTPGFRARPGSPVGTCPLCAAHGVTMARLFYKPDVTTPLPTTTEEAKTLVKATRGPAVCDACSTYCVPLGHPADNRRKLAGALPQISAASDQPAYRKKIREIFGTQPLSSSLGGLKNGAVSLEDAALAMLEKLSLNDAAL